MYFKFRRHIWDPVPYLGYVEKLDKARMGLAQQYFESVDANELNATLGKLSGNSSSPPDIVIAILSAARNKDKNTNPPEYLTETVSKLLSQMTHPDFVSDFPYSVKVIVCNGGTDPSLNTPAIRLEKYVKVVNMTSKSPPKDHQETLRHESMDCVLCIREALTYSSRYLLVLEDDAYAKDDMWSLLKFVISKKLDHRISRDETIADNSQVAHVKLMRPDYQLCYFKRGLQHKLELLGTSVLLGTLINVLHDYIQKCLHPDSSNRREYLTWFAWCVYVFLVLLVIGRPCLLELRRLLAPHFYIYVPSQKCCNQAVLFPRHGGEAFMKYLYDTGIKNSVPKDLAMDHMLVDKRMEGYQVLPSAFSHIGHISSLYSGKNIFQVL